MNARGRKSVLLLPLLWLAVVVVVAGLTWRVIDAAGRDVLTSGAPSPLPAAGTTPQADGGSSGVEPTPKDGAGRGGGPSPTQSPRATATPRAPATASVPSPAPTSVPTSGPTSVPSSPTAPAPTRRPSAPPSTTPDQPPAQPESQVRSWQGSAGTVTTACRGTAISLQSVTPNDGWQVEVDDRGPGRVRVELTSRGDDERETRVEAVCSGGVPRFEVRTDD